MTGSLTAVREAAQASDGRPAYDLLAEAARAVHGSVELEAKLAWTVDAARSITRATHAAYVCFDDDTGEPWLVAGSGVALDDLALVRLSRVFGPITAGPVQVDDTRLHARPRSGRGTSAIGSFLAAPVSARAGKPHGALLLGHTDAGHFDEDDNAIVVALVMHLGVALDNFDTMVGLAELEAAQREVVHQLQEAVRPPMPPVDAVELGVYYEPAEPEAGTGGDLYDWVVLSDGDLHVAVVDVMGKGVAATKDALAVSHALRFLAIDGCPLDRMVVRADELVRVQSPELVATVVVARYSPESGVVRLVGAGHPPALVVSRAGDVREVDVPGVPIGWPGAGSDQVVTLTLERSQTLVLYTDGIVEATKDIVAGLDALARAAADTARYPARHMARALVERALAGAARRDDSLILVLRRRTAPVATDVHRLGPFEYRFTANPAAVPLARHLFTDWLEHQPVDQEEVADLLLIASELCSNAVRHATDAPGAAALRAWAEGDSIVVEAEDDGAFPVEPLAAGLERPPVYAEQGRGLYLVDALADEVATRVEDGRTVVRCVRRAVLA